MNIRHPYRLRAFEFETKANAEIDPDIRLEFLILAASYSRLADHADCNSRIDLVYETPAPRAAVALREVVDRCAILGGV